MTELQKQTVERWQRLCQATLPGEMAEWLVTTHYDGTVAVSFGWVVQDPAVSWRKVRWDAIIYIGPRGSVKALGPRHGLRKPYDVWDAVLSAPWEFGNQIYRLDAVDEHGCLLRRAYIKCKAEVIARHKADILKAYLGCAAVDVMAVK